ncbi:exonuclease sbcCD subunit D [Staphylococcus delphini]|uniref:Nuclease SbcCD subunit D n=1 Tax=Staphylococcus delphini TaxID=53344 RepID=A0AAX0QW67_9STAP|nr:exonuclease subunit SbcD [Staphylococcus delphini]PCF34727.1 exonuclease sbcCD subunit D [Staphylococcus delphini]PCF51928.1 exonuclease sbcCD subunit D [Staphylococcus delphini]UXS43327.1 exonuclease SbcCD subunit D [Staphylococcus delphini]UXV44021.1 exonuclease SbcCD subunit D [Staphylococcus delphini]
MELKLIHTADWHLGKVLNGHSFLEDQQYVLKQLIEVLEHEQPDALIIAGDIYDTAYPSKYVIQLMEETIAKINLEMQIPIVMINGNHDGKERLRYGASWFRHNQLYITTEIEQFFEPVILGNVAIYTLPFFTLSEAREYLEVSVEYYEEAVKKLVDQVRPQLNPAMTNILVGHFTLTGAPKSDSERDITIGTIEAVSPQFLLDFDAVMLGHIHHPFASQYQNVVYSGSLLQYSFSEVQQAKGVRLFHIEADQAMRQSFIPLKPARELEVVEASFDDIMNGRFKRKSDDSYFHFNVEHLTHVKDPMQKLKQIYPNTLSLTQQTLPSSYQSKILTDVKKLSPLDIVDRFYSEMTTGTLSETQKSNVIQLLETMNEEE